MIRSGIDSLNETTTSFNINDHNSAVKFSEETQL
jgi:hypothetical protein